MWPSAARIIWGRSSHQAVHNLSVTPTGNLPQRENFADNRHAICHNHVWIIRAFGME